MRKLSSQYLPIVIVLVFLMIVPVFASPYVIVIMFFWFFYMAIAEAWNLLAGYTGLISLGQHVFVGLGGYMLAIASVFWGLSVWVGVVLGGVVSLIFAVFLATITLKMKGIYFALGTMISGEVLRLWFNNWDYVNAGAGIFIKPAYGVTTLQLYYASFFIGFASVFLTQIILNTKFGLALKAMRDDQDAASTSGVDISRTRVIIFAISAFITGAAASVFFLYQVYVQPTTAFNFAMSLSMLLAASIGGTGTVAGPVIGAGIVVVLDQWLANYPGTSLIIQGVITLTIILLAPRGVMGTLKRSTRYQALIKRIMKPSK